MEAYKALYIHIPFCASRCAYCDFFARAAKKDDPEIDEYVERCVLEIFRLGRAGRLSDIESVYIGGGTPSHIGSSRLSSLMYALGISMNLTPDIEVTLECNPESFDDRLAKDMYALGVNRLSFGVQSFNDETLRMLGRAHSAKEAKGAIHAARSRFDNIGLDLICGVPGQQMEDIEHDLECACALRVGHLSLYALTLEDETALAKRIAAGELEEPDEDLCADMLQFSYGYLEDRGFEHYEVSNFAKPGRRCRHNMAYWTGKPYLGVGRGAVGMRNVPEGRIREKDGVVVDGLSPSQAACEDAILAMRTIDGIPVNRLDELEDAGFLGIKDTFLQLGKDGLVSLIDGRFRPTDKGFLLGNEIYMALLDFFK